MKTRSLALAGILLGLAAVTFLRAAPQPAPAKAPSKLAQAKVQAARRTYEVIWRNNMEGLAPFAELAYRWSRRWLDAELEVSDKKADRAAAYEAHLTRMRHLARATRGRWQNRVNTVEEVTATDYYIVEAEIWLEQARK